MSGTGKHEKLIEFPIDHAIILSFIATEFPGACALECKYPTELRTLKLADDVVHKSTKLEGWKDQINIVTKAEHINHLIKP